MALSPQFITLVTKAFGLAEATGSDKKKLLETMKTSLLRQPNDKVAYSEFSKALKPDSDFSKAIDKQRISGLFRSATSTRLKMDGLQKDLIRLEEQLGKSSVSLNVMNDSSGHGFGKVLSKVGQKDNITKAYDLATQKSADLESLAYLNMQAGDQDAAEENLRLAGIVRNMEAEEAAKFISKGSLFTIYNKAGLDYKGQSNYAALTVLKGGGLDIKVNLLTIFFPPAAALGFSASVKASGNLLRGQQMIVYSEVINGNNGNWKLPAPDIVSQTLIENIVSELSKLDSVFFEQILIRKSMQGLKPDDINNMEGIFGILSEVPFTSPPSLLNKQPNPNQYAAGYTIEDREGGCYADDIYKAVGRAQKNTEFNFSRTTTGENYSAIIAAGCMRGVAWEWMGKVGLEVSWSPLNLACAENVTQFLKTSSYTTDDTAQYLSLSISCSLTAETTAGRTNRSFIATDPNARLFAKGGNQSYKDSYEKMSSYISDCVRFSTDESLVEYIDTLFRSYYAVSTSNYKKLTLHELHKKTLNKIVQAKQFKCLKNITDDHRSDGMIDGLIPNLEHIENLLWDRINQKKSDNPISFFVIAYSGTTWEFGAKAEGRLGLKFSNAQKSSPAYGTGAKGSELAAEFLKHTRSYRTSRYTIQVPVIKKNMNSPELPEKVSSSLASREGVVEIKYLCENAPESLRFKTQETIVYYRQIETKDLTDLKLEANAIPVPLPPSKAASFLRTSTIWKKEPPKLKPILDSSFLNTIEYKTATAVWENTVPNSPLTPLSCVEGSGRSYGQAFLLTKLFQLATMSKPYHLGKVDIRWKILADSLHITPENLITFFESKEFREAMPRACPGKENPWAKENFEAQEGCILIESTFSLKNLMNITLKKNRSKSPSEFNITPESLLESNALPDVKINDPLYALQSIRLRYRMADLKEDKSTPFKLGLFLPEGTSVGIRIEEVENIGMAGIVDICTYWYGQSASGTVMYNRDETVQSTVLLTQ